MDFTADIEINDDVMPKLFGTYDENVRLIEELLPVKISAFNGSVCVRGSEYDVKTAELLIKKLVELLRSGFEVNRLTVRQSVDMIRLDMPDEIMNLSKDAIAVTARGKQIKCKTLGQRDYVKLIGSNTIVFGVGPAGTGKTYLATAMAVAAYKRGEVDRIILTRPAIEAGEKLGFLPGDLQDKVDPYLRPLYDALREMFGVDSYTKLIERGIIEIAPLAYMRGRTLSNAFIILDEAQNTTSEQMKMFLTRMGENSRMIVNGDETQIDLPEGKKSGLKEAVRILKNIDGIGICRLTEKDIVRHELVQKIVSAYDKATSAAAKSKSGGSAATERLK